MIYCVRDHCYLNLPIHFISAQVPVRFALSLTTGLLAVSILLSSAFSQALGRKGLMFVSMGLAAPAEYWPLPMAHILLIARAVQGFVIGGVPAVAMAWIAEEIHPLIWVKPWGYIAGTTFGGMMGRVGMGLLTQYFSWRVALGVLGVICLICALGFLWLLPKSQNFIMHKKGYSFSFIYLLGKII